MIAATEQTSTGLPANVAAALAYAFGPVTGALFLAVERESTFVRYHAAHAVAVSVALLPVGAALALASSLLAAAIPLLGWLVALMLNIAVALGVLALWIFLLLQALRGLAWEAPLVGRLARARVTSIG